MKFSGFLRSAILLSASLYAGLSQADTVAAGLYHSLLVRSDGSLWSWGWNADGQLGIGVNEDGISENQSFPVQVTDLINVAGAAGGTYHSLAVTADGAVWAWGQNWYYQLGDGTQDSHPAPVAVDTSTGLTGVVAVAAGELHSLALKNDGTVWAWGNNGSGQLGDNTSIPKSSPVQVRDQTDQTGYLTGVTAIAAGQYFSMALKSDGRVWVWGYGGWGALCNNTGSNALTPIQCGGIDNVAKISAGWAYGAVIKADGIVWSWGDNGAGQLGRGSTGYYYYEPLAINATSAVGIAASAYHTFAVRDDGSLLAWGFNAYGQLGVDYPNAHNTPTPVPGISGVAAVAAGDHSLAVANYRGVPLTWGWGPNYYGQVGDGTTMQRNIPVLLHPPFDADGDGLLDWQEYVWNSDPLNTDTNGDAISDGDDVLFGFNPSNLDLDEDGIPNAAEYILGTNPFWNDTDGDGVVDGQDAFPLDPTRSQGWPPDPNDHTPPVITITFPTTGITPL